MKVIFVLGLQGMGKSRYIAEHYPGAHRIDIEVWWRLVKQLHPGFQWYEQSEWTKRMTYRQLLHALEQKHELITLEITGVTMPSQAAVSMMQELALAYRHETEIVYLRPLDLNAFRETLDDNPEAIKMLESSQNGGRNWREPHLCSYLRNVRIIEVDHTQWTWEEKQDRWAEQAWADYEDEQRERRAVHQGVG